MKDSNSGFAVLEALVLVLIGSVVALGAISLQKYTGNAKQSQVFSTSSETFTTSQSTDIANEDGDSLSTSGQKWLGNGTSTPNSYLGIRFTGSTVPQNASISSARVEFGVQSDQWISLAFEVRAENSNSPGSFSSSSKPSSRTLTSASKTYSDNVKWTVGSVYTYDVTPLVQELVNSAGRDTVVLIFKGTGGAYGRKFINSDPKLVIDYSTTETGVATATLTPTLELTSTPVVTKAPTPTKALTPTPTMTPTPISTASPTATNLSSGEVPLHMQVSALTGELIYGVAPAASLGTCTAAIHDRYVTRGPDGRLYRTWHPTTVPVDPNNPNGSKCSFAHEHGDDPSTSNIYKGPVPFSYIGSTVGIDMPHVGYKCFVHNKGLTNDEGSAALHDDYYCFHMGTAGTGRYTAQFHELYFNLRSSSGYTMNLQGLADTGGVAGTICNNPRHGRTVQGLGCLLDSAYEIWADDLSIRNKGNTVAFAEISTAVFDPITTMDPNDLSRVIYTWDPEVQQKTFKFNDNRSNFRGCVREAYTGPLQWYNQGGSNTYYTDAYGNVIDGGPLKQEISTIRTSANSGFVDKYGALIMTYKSGNQSDPQSQYKYKKSACVPGLGLQN